MRETVSPDLPSARFCILERYLKVSFAGRQTREDYVVLIARDR